MRSERFEQIFPYIFGVLTVVFDGAYFDLLPLLVVYMVFEYQRFKGFGSALRVLLFLLLHSSVCFKSITFTHLVIFSIYVLFLVLRNYFLSPFVPFAVYSAAVCLIVLINGTYLPTLAVLFVISLLLWRKYEVS